MLSNFTLEKTIPIPKCFCFTIHQLTNGKTEKEYNIEPVVYDSWADPVVAKQEYGVDLITKIEELPKADCLIVAVDHNEYRSMSVMKLKEMFKSELADEEKVIVDVKSLYRIDELKASGMRFWRL